MQNIIHFLNRTDSYTYSIIILVNTHSGAKIRVYIIVKKENNKKVHCFNVQ